MMDLISHLFHSFIVCGKFTQPSPDVGTQPPAPAGEPEVKPPLSPPSGMDIVVDINVTIIFCLTKGRNHLTIGIFYGRYSIFAKHG